MSKYLKSVIILLSILFVFETAVYIAAFDRPYWGDESHFVETINEFGNEISINAIKHYNEMSTPLPFLAYALWGELFGFEISSLRLFSIIIALLTYFFFHKLLFSFFRNSKIAILGTLFFAFHPYMIGLSVFVFTDMITILLIILAFLAVKKENYILLFISSAGALLSRQYSIFFISSIGLYYLLDYLRDFSDKKKLKLLLAVSFSIIPLIALFLLWGGFNPVNQARNLYIHEAFTYHFDYLSLYIAQIFIYMFPIFLIIRKEIYNKPVLIYLSILFSLYYWIFPVRACEIQTKIEVHTVGFFHKVLNFIAPGSSLFSDIVFYLGFLFALPFLLLILKEVYEKVIKKYFDLTFMMDVSILSFLIVMPFSYMHWEKYFLLLMPILMLRLLLLKYPVVEKNGQDLPSS